MSTISVLLNSHSDKRDFLLPLRQGRDRFNLKKIHSLHVSGLVNELTLIKRVLGKCLETIFKIIEPASCITIIIMD